MNLEFIGAPSPPKDGIERIIEIRRVEAVEEIGAEMQPQPFDEIELLGEDEIHIPVHFFTLADPQFYVKMCKDL